MIQVSGLSKHFRVARRDSGLRAAAKAFVRREETVVEALRNVSFDIDEGEMVGYIGPNGAGKSTTIKMMCGIMVPDRGTCRVAGRIPWEDRIAHVRDIGVVFGQRSQLWWDVPVMDSFTLLKDIYGVEDAAFRQSLGELTEALDLQPLLRTPVRQLSLGQRMRCEIAASLLHRPRVLFLDEPTIGLDAVSKIAVRNFVRDINLQRKVTVILTTHDMQDIEALASRILLIGKGQLLYDGTLAGIRGRCGTRKRITADFATASLQPVVPGAVCIDWQPERMVLEVENGIQGVSEVIGHLSAQVELMDVTVENPPVEELVAGLYREYAL